MTPLQRKWLEYFLHYPGGIVPVDRDGYDVLGRGWGQVNRVCRERGWIEYYDETQGTGRCFRLTDAGRAALEAESCVK